MNSFATEAFPDVDDGTEYPWVEHCPCLRNDRHLKDATDATTEDGALWEVLYVCAILLFMFLALLSDKIGADWVMVTALALCIAAKIITIKEGLEGFANEGLLTVLILFVVAEGISRTGALDWYMGKLLGKPKTIAGAQVRLMIPISLVSAFMNNTPVVAIMIPITQRWAKSIGVSRQQLLIPLSFASILGGTCTLIGTSTNLVVQGLLLKRYGDLPEMQIGLFDLGEYGVPVALIGVSYVLLVSPFFLPGGKNSKSSNGMDPFQDSEDLLLGARVTPWSPAANRTVKRSGLRDTGGIYLVSVHRVATGNVHRAVSQDFVLTVGDILYFTGLVEGFGEFCAEHGLEVVTNEVNDIPETTTMTVTEDDGADVLQKNTMIASYLSSVGEGPDSEEGMIPCEIGVTKESIIHADEAERLRSINQLTDQIRGQTQSDMDAEIPMSPIRQRAKHHSSAHKKTEKDPTKIVVTTDTYDSDRSVIVGVDAQDRAGLLLDISKGLLRLNLQLRHTEAKVIDERSLSIWRCECIETELPDLEEVWSVLNALLEESHGTEAIKKRGLRVVRAVVTPSSRLVGSTAADLNFRNTYKAAIIAVQKGGKNSPTSVTFHAGDVLILQAAENSPLLKTPPEDFYEKLGKPNPPSRATSVKALVNLVKGGTGVSKRGDLETHEAPALEPSSADVEAGNDDFLIAQEDHWSGDEAQTNDSQQRYNDTISVSTEMHDLAWKDLRVIFASNDSSADSGANQKEFLTAMEVAPHSQLANKTVQQLGIAKLPGVFLVSIERPLGNASAVQRSSRANIVSFLGGLRGGVHAGSGASEIVDEHSILDNVSVKFIPIAPEETLQAGDILWFSGSASGVGDLRKIPGLKSVQSDEVEKVKSQIHERRLVQAVIARKGPLVGKTVKEVRFRTHYGAAVIAVNREGKRVHDHPGKIKLQAGDVLLLEAGPTFISKNSENDRSFALLAEVENSAPPRLGKFVLALFLTVTMLVLTTFEISTLLVAALFAAILMVSFGILSQQEARNAVNWEVFVTIGCAFGIGTALTNSGVAGGLADFLVNVGTALGIGGKLWSIRQTTTRENS
jgi:di/tricarboxylate transporter